MTCQTQNNVQCYSQFLEKEACALWEPGTLIVLDLCWFSNEVWQKLTGVLGFLWHFFLRSLQIIVSSLWLEHNFLSCRATYYILGSVSWWSSRSGDYMFWKSLVRNARCARFQNMTSLILWIYFIALWTRCDFSEFFFSCSLRCQKGSQECGLKAKSKSSHWSS
jgi:hypothetical protein